MAERRVSGAAKSAKAMKKPAARAGSSEERLLAVAAEQFAAGGFAGTPIRQIASAAGVTLPTIYHFFGGKRALYERVCMSIFGRENGTLKAALELSDDPVMRLLYFARALLRILTTEVDFARLLQRELIEQDYSLVADTTRVALVPHFDVLSAAVRALGDDRDDFDCSIAIYALAFGLTQLRPVWQALGHSDTVLQSHEKTAVFILQLIFPQVDWLAAEAPVPVKSRRLRAAR